MIYGRDAQALPAFRDARALAICETKSGIAFWSRQIDLVLRHTRPERRDGQMRAWVAHAQQRRRHLFESYRQLCPPRKRPALRLVGGGDR